MHTDSPQICFICASENVAHDTVNRPFPLCESCLALGDAERYALLQLRTLQKEIEVAIYGLDQMRVQLQTVFAGMCKVNNIFLQ